MKERVFLLIAIIGAGAVLAWQLLASNITMMQWRPPPPTYQLGFVGNNYIVTNIASGAIVYTSTNAQQALDYATGLGATIAVENATYPETQPSILVDNTGFQGQSTDGTVFSANANFYQFISVKPLNGISFQDLTLQGVPGTGGNTSISPSFYASNVLYQRVHAKGFDVFRPVNNFAVNQYTENNLQLIDCNIQPNIMTQFGATKVLWQGGTVGGASAHCNLFGADYTIDSVSFSSTNPNALQPSGADLDFANIQGCIVKNTTHASILSPPNYEAIHWEYVDNLPAPRDFNVTNITANGYTNVIHQLLKDHKAIDLATRINIDTVNANNMSGDVVFLEGIDGATIQNITVKTLIGEGGISIVGQNVTIDTVNIEGRPPQFGALIYIAGNNIMIRNLNLYVHAPMTAPNFGIREVPPSTNVIPFLSQSTSGHNIIQNVRMTLEDPTKTIPVSTLDPSDVYAP